MAINPTANTVADPWTKPLTEPHISKFTHPFLAYQSESSELSTDRTTLQRETRGNRFDLNFVSHEPPPQERDMLLLARKKKRPTKSFEQVRHLQRKQRQIVTKEKPTTAAAPTVVLREHVNLAIFFLLYFFWMLTVVLREHVNLAIFLLREHVNLRK